MQRLLQVFMAVILLSSDKACAQPGIEGYWGKSDINVRLSVPARIHDAPLDLSPRYFEAHVIPLQSVELIDVRAQLCERAKSLGGHLEKLGQEERSRVIEAYLRHSLRIIGGVYDLSKSRILRTSRGEDEYEITYFQAMISDRLPDASVHDRDGRMGLDKSPSGAVVPDADPAADAALLERHLPPAFALHLDLLAKKEISEETIRKVLSETNPTHPRDRYGAPVILDYLRYQLVRRILAKDSYLFTTENEVIARDKELLDARKMCELIRSHGGMLFAAALHKIADVEIARFSLPKKIGLKHGHLEEALRILRLCKEQGDPTAVGSIADIVRDLRWSGYSMSWAELSELPETRRALASYVNLPGLGTKKRLDPVYLREETTWVDKLASLNIRDDEAFIRLAAGLHDAGEKESCLRVLAMCPPGDGIVQLIHAHHAVDRRDYAAALSHLATAERELGGKARRHAVILSGHPEYGLKCETMIMYGRVLVEQASLLLHRGDFLGAARKLRQTEMDFFNQEYVLGCLLTTKELRQLADEESPVTDDMIYNGWESDEDQGPMSRRDPPHVIVSDDLSLIRHASARMTLARRLLQEGKAKESLPYWDIKTQPDAAAYVHEMQVAEDLSRTKKERGLAYWRAAKLIHKNPNLWCCTAGHDLISGKFEPRVAMANRENTKNTEHVGQAEQDRIRAAKTWIAPRNSFFRYGIAEHCQKAAELLDGEQSAYALWFGALAIAFIDQETAAPMRQKLLKDYGATKIGRQAIAVKGLPRHVEAPEMK